MARNSPRVPGALPERPALPSNVLHSILALLSQADLRKAAGASRAFRKAAKQAGLCIRRTIKWDHTVDIGPEIAILNAVITRASEDDCRISLAVSYVGEQPYTPTHKEELYALTRDPFELLAGCISRAMDYLVFLRVSVPDYLRTELDAVLLAPAPNLHTFQIHDCGTQGASRNAPLIRLPSDLFAGDAPKLRSVSLEYVPLGPARFEAFSRVEHFRMQYEDLFPDTDVPHHFPRLSSLDIAFRDKCGGPPTPNCVLQGLELQKLTVEVEEPGDSLLTTIADELDLSSIRVIECHGYAGARRTIWAAPLVAVAESELSARISRHKGCKYDVEIEVTSRDADWQCTYVIHEWALEQPYAFFGTDVHFITLRLDNMYLPGLLESGIWLSRLRELRIDLRPRGKYAAMIWPRSWGVMLTQKDGGGTQVYRVPCPALETLSIVALKRPMQVRDAEVANLIEALGQFGREKGVHVQLVLKGVTLISAIDQVCTTQFVPFHEE